MEANGESRESHRKARALQGACHTSPAAPSGAVSLLVIHQLGKTQGPEAKGISFEFHGLIQSGAEILQFLPTSRTCEVKPGPCVCMFEI